MSLNKIFVEVETEELFNTLKISNSEDDDTYTIGKNGVTTYGKPQIKYHQIVFIKDTGKIYHNGIFYGSYEELLNRLNYDEEVISASLNEIVNEINNSSTANFIIGDTIYVEEANYSNGIISFPNNIIYDKNTDTIIINDEI